jgi:leucyl-tRNA synthetase
VHRFLRSIWREIVGEDGGLTAKIVTGPESDAETERLLHATIKKVTEDIEGLRYNTAISQMMIFRNQLQKAPTISRDTIRTLLQLLQPLAPHIASELWDRLGERVPIHIAQWPVADESKLVSATVKLVIQVNGKLRSDAMVAPDAAEAEVLALAKADPKITPYLEGKTLRKVIYVPGRILNLVVG